MSKKVQAILVDDIDGSEAEGTVLFGLDGTDYEIELSKDHADDLRAALEPFTTYARKISAPARKQRRAPGAASGTGGTGGNPDTVAIRAWAEKRGISLKNRGRVPAGIVEQYRAATGA